MIELIVRDKEGEVVYAENAHTFVFAEEALGRAERWVQRNRPDLLEYEPVTEF